MENTRIQRAQNFMSCLVNVVHQPREQRMRGWQCSFVSVLKGFLHRPNLFACFSYRILSHQYLFLGWEQYLSGKLVRLPGGFELDIQRLGLVSLCSQASMPSIVFEQGELFRYVHPIKPPVTSMNREKVEAVLRKNLQPF